MLTGEAVPVRKVAYSPAVDGPAYDPDVHKACTLYGGTAVAQVRAHGQAGGWPGVGAPGAATWLLTCRRCRCSALLQAAVAGLAAAAASATAAAAGSRCRARHCCAATYPLLLAPPTPPRRRSAPAAASAWRWAWCAAPPSGRPRAS